VASVLGERAAGVLTSAVGRRRRRIHMHDVGTGDLATGPRPRPIGKRRIV
jgi:hypothetical protein